jgi:phosphonopyruvate decarboxylase
MIRAAHFCEQALALGFRFYTGVPCSYLKPFINYAIDAAELEYVGAANEGDAVAIAAGATLGGKSSVVMFQNSGFGNAVNPLTSLNAIFQIPVLLIVTWRGEPGGDADEPQHELMGEITPGMLDILRIPYAFFPREENEIAPVLSEACRCMAKTGLPYGLIMRKGQVADYALRSSPQPRPARDGGKPIGAWPERRPTRSEVLQAVQRHSLPSDAIIATTGFMGRALYALNDRPNQFYMVGSMGCAASLSFGLAAAQPHRRVIVLDGDGAALMRLSIMATLGYERPSNLLHVLIDNETHASTGGQATVSHSVDLGAVARACGYARVCRAGTTADLVAIMRETQPTRTDPMLTLAHVKVCHEEVEKLPRPTLTPRQVAARFRAWLHDTAPCERAVG